jgi:hypothetical protein
MGSIKNEDKKLLYKRSKEVSIPLYIEDYLPPFPPKVWFVLNHEPIILKNETSPPLGGLGGQDNKRTRIGGQIQQKNRGWGAETTKEP